MAKDAVKGLVVVAATSPVGDGNGEDAVRGLLVVGRPEEGKPFSQPPAPAAVAKDAVKGLPVIVAATGHVGDGEGVVKGAARRRRRT